MQEERFSKFAYEFLGILVLFCVFIVAIAASIGLGFSIAFTIFDMIGGH